MERFLQREDELACIQYRENDARGSAHQKNRGSLQEPMFATLDLIYRANPERMEVPSHKLLEMDFGHVIKDILA